MQLGIFAKTFLRPTVEEALDAVKAHGLDCVQFNFSCAGLPSMPERIDPGLARRIARAAQTRGIRMAAVSGTFNMIHPDPRQRQDGLRRLRVLAAACCEMGVPIITLCTGTRDPRDMWRHHPANDSPEAWRDLLATMTEALRIAEEADVTLAFEPEVSNVVDSAVKARRLLEEARSPRLKVVMDGANLFHAGELPRMGEILREAFSLLGERLVIAHAKDLSRDGEAGNKPAGTGLLDYDCYLGLLRQYGFHGPVILHGLSEAEVPASIAFVRGKLARIAAP
jgi:sugar phosphate isomerase/epimerase